MGRFIDITGERYGQVEVLEDDSRGQPTKNRTVRAKCLACGNEFRPFKGLLRQGTTTDCGCVFANRHDRYVGKRFGRLVVCENWGHGKVLCLCDCGHEHESDLRKLLTYNTRSCGCLRKDILRESRGRFVAINGERKTLTEWGEVLGITRERARQLHNKGKLVARVLEGEKDAD